MKTGDKAPQFVLPDANGENWSLADHSGKTVVLLFYPGDNTPVCTAQLCSVRDNWADYVETGAEVVGISTDSVDSHRSFSSKYDLTLRLLADEDAAVAKLYDATSWLPGRSARAVVVIDKDGIVRYHKVQSLSVFRPKDDEVLEAIRAAA